MPDFNKTKIMFVLPALTAGGAERVMITLMNGLDRDRYAPCLVSVSDKGDLHDLIDQDIDFCTLKQKHLALGWAGLFQHLRREKPDVVISTMAHMNFVLLTMRPFFPKTKFIVREAITPSFLFNKYKKTSWLIKLMYQILYPAADAVLSPSQIIFDEFRDVLRMSSKNFFVLNNPVNTKTIRACYEALSKKDAAHHKSVHFLAVGRLGRQKGFDRLIEYLPRLSLPYDWTLTILGEGDEREHLESLIRKHGFEDKVFMPGLVRPPWQHYLQADCFLMPSRYEGLPNVVLESLACGVPVIATRESGGIAYIRDHSPKGAVRVVDSMHEFVQAMEQVKPGKASHKKSLLNEMFEQQAVFRHFVKILHTVQR